MNRSPFLPLGLLTLGLVLASCAPAPKGASTPKETPKPTAETPKPAEPAAPGTTPALDLAKLPPALKGDAYEYYGLGRTEPVDMEVSQGGRAVTQTGAQITRLVAVEGDEATFEIERTGTLADTLGSMQVRLAADGITVKSATMAKVGERDIEMPANLAPGSKWSARTVVDRPPQSLDVTNEFVVRGVEKVQTKAALREALRVDSTGQGTLQGQKVKMESKTWYAKGIGMVKSVLTTTGASGKPEVITIQETK